MHNVYTILESTHLDKEYSLANRLEVLNAYKEIIYLVDQRGYEETLYKHSIYRALAMHLTTPGCMCP